MIHRQLVNLKMTKMDVSQIQLAAYCGLNVNKINTFVAGTKDLANPDLEKVNETLAHLEKLSIIFHPVPIDFRKVPEIKSLVRDLLNGEFTEDIIRKAIRNRPELDLIEGSSLKQLKARYEMDKEFQREIDELLRESVQKKEVSISM
jgi:hypothetical protein